MFGLLIVPIYLFFLLKESPRIAESWSNYLPLRRSEFKDEVVTVLTEINGYLINFFRGQLVVALINAVLLAIGLSIVGLQFGFLIGLGFAFFGIIPYVGYIICYIPAVLIAFAQFNDWAHPLWVTIIFFLIVAQIDGPLRIVLALVFVSTSSLCAHAQGAAQPTAGTAPRHVRCLDARAQQLLSAARANGRQSSRPSSTELEASDVAVYLKTTAPPTRVAGMPRGTTNLLSATAGGRYLQVWVDVRRTEAERVAVLGHELQHALEVAADAGVRDALSLATLFERLGTENGACAGRARTRQFETAMAQQVEARVLAEAARCHRESLLR